MLEYVFHVLYIRVKVSPFKCCYDFCRKKSRCGKIVSPLDFSSNMMAPNGTSKNYFGIFDLDAQSYLPCRRDARNQPLKFVLTILLELCKTTYPLKPEKFLILC